MYFLGEFVWLQGNDISLGVQFHCSKKFLDPACRASSLLVNMPFLLIERWAGFVWHRVVEPRKRCLVWQQVWTREKGTPRTRGHYHLVHGSMCNNWDSPLHGLLGRGHSCSALAGALAWAASMSDPSGTALPWPASLYEPSSCRNDENVGMEF